MFRVGLGELVVLGVIGLVVLGGVAAVFFLVVKSQKKP